MCERDRSQTPNARRTQDRCDHAIPDVEGSAARQPTGVDQQRSAWWKSNEWRITLSDVEERDVQEAITGRTNRRPRFGHNPQRGSRRSESNASTEPAGSDGFGAAGDPNAAPPQPP